MEKSKANVNASCHCGSVQLEIKLLNGLDEIIRCNCSICSRGKGFGMFCIPLIDFKIIKGEKSIRKYTFKTATAPHFFCRICGIHTHHKSRARPDRICVNISCIKDINIHDFRDKLIDFNGINHPRDN